MEVAADDVGAPATGTMAKDRQDPPRGRVEQVEDGNLLRRLTSAHRMLIAVRDHDDVALARPERLAVVPPDPALPRGHDVEDDQPLRAGAENPRQLDRR